MKAKYVAGSKELEKLKKQLASYEKQLQEQQDTQDTSRALSGKTLILTARTSFQFSSSRTWIDKYENV